MAITIPDIKRGDTWATSFDWTQPDGQPVDLIDCTARMMVRDKKTKALALSLSTATGELTIDVAHGSVALRVESAVMQAITPSAYITDLEITFPDGSVTSTDTIGFKIIEDVTHD